MANLEDMNVAQLQDYLRGLYAIDLRNITSEDRTNMREVKAELLKHNVQFVFKGHDNIKFRKVK